MSQPWKGKGLNLSNPPFPQPGPLLPHPKALDFLSVHGCIQGSAGVESLSLKQLGDPPLRACHGSPASGFSLSSLPSCSSPSTPRRQRYSRHPFPPGHSTQGPTGGFILFDFPVFFFSCRTRRDWAGCSEAGSQLRRTFLSMDRESPLSSILEILQGMSLLVTDPSRAWCDGS